jgi:hypothetical protein
MFSSMLLTLLIVPLFYLSLERVRATFLAWRGGEAAAQTA